jgi:hypothetical protein
MIEVTVNEIANAINAIDGMPKRGIGLKLFAESISEANMVMFQKAASERYYGEISDLASRMSNLRNAIGEDREEDDRDTVVAKEIILTALSVYPSCFSLILPSIDEEGKFSYSRSGEETDSSRQKTTFGRIIRRQVRISEEIIPDHTLAKISEFVVTKIWDDTSEVMVLKGDEIVNAYRQYTGTSCMNEDRCKFVEYVRSNEDKVSLLAVFSRNCCVAKALLWTTDEEELFLDRLYHHDSYHSKGMLILRHARKMNANVSSNPYSGRIGALKKVTLDLSNCKYLPYFDSFVSVSSQNKDMSEVCLSTNGIMDFHYIYGEGIYECSVCQRRHAGRYCPSCNKDNYLSNIGAECDSCGYSSLDGLYFCEEDNVYYCDGGCE